MKAIHGFLLMLLAIVFLSGIGLTGCGGDDDDDDDATDDDAEDDDDAADDDSADDDSTDDDSTDDDSTDDDSTDDDDDSFDDWFPPQAGDLGIYRINGFGDHWDVPGEIVGEDSTTFPGETYWVLAFGDFSQPGTAGAKIWADFSTPFKPGIRAMEGFEADSKDGEWTIREVFDDVLYVGFNGDIDETMTDSTSGTMYFQDADPINFDLQVDSTLKSLSATTQVPYGTVDNCIQVEVLFSDPAYPGSYWGGDFFFHPVFGFVEAAVFPVFDVVELVSPAE